MQKLKKFIADAKITRQDVAGFIALAILLLAGAIIFWHYRDKMLHEKYGRYHTHEVQSR